MSSNRLQMGRRQFLIFSSTAAVATATLGPKLFASGAVAINRLSVGFAPFDADVAAAPASSIPAADGVFITRGAHVTVYGPKLAAGAGPRTRRVVDLLAHYSIFEGAERTTIPFRAWGCSRNTGCEGAVTRFTVPVDESQQLVFSLESERGMPAGAPANRRSAFSAPTESTVSPVSLSLTSEEGSLKLVRGFYVIVPMIEGESEPRWSSYAVREIENRWTLVDAEGNVAPFEHIVLRIDYASAS